MAGRIIDSHIKRKLPEGTPHPLVYLLHSAGLPQGYVVMIKAFSKTCMAGLIVLVPAWATFLILRTLFTTLDGLVGRYISDPLPGLGLLLLIVLLIVVGLIADHVIGQGLLARLEQRIEKIPLVWRAGCHQRTDGAPRRTRRTAQERILGRQRYLL